jgi:hypothetical protein
MVAKRDHLTDSFTLTIMISGHSAIARPPPRHITTTSIVNERSSRHQHDEFQSWLEWLTALNVVLPLFLVISHSSQLTALLVNKSLDCLFDNEVKRTHFKDDLALC